VRRSWVCLSNVLDSLFITDIYDLENVLALEPRLIEPRWLLYCELKSDDVFVEGDSGDVINPDDQIYTKSNANGVNKYEHDFYTAVLTLTERFGMHGIRIFKDSGNTPELAYRALLRQVAMALTDSGYVAM
jgi:hypothetical protein